MKPNRMRFVAAAAFGLIATLGSTPPAAAFNVGRRRIRCSPLPDELNALALDPNLAVPAVVAFAGAQAALPSLAKCPSDVQFQFPWFVGTGPGFCPVGYWSAAGRKCLMPRAQYRKKHWYLHELDYL